MGAFVLTVASTPLARCDALCVQVLGGPTPVCWPGACGRIPVYVRHACVDLLDAAWGIAMCRMGLLCILRAYRVGVWFGSVRFALLIVVVICWVDRCFDSWVLLGLICLLRVTK